MIILSSAVVVAQVQDAFEEWCAVVADAHHAKETETWADREAALKRVELLSSWPEALHDVLPSVCDALESAHPETLDALTAEGFALLAQAQGERDRLEKERQRAERDAAEAEELALMDLMEEKEKLEADPPEEFMDDVMLCRLVDPVVLSSGHLHHPTPGARGLHPPPFLSPGWYRPRTPCMDFETCFGIHARCPRSVPPSLSYPGVVQTSNTLHGF